MATYLVLGRFRSSFDLGQAKDRIEKVKKALASVGGTLHSVHYLMGRYDFVSFIEAPDDNAMAAFLQWYAKLGVAETVTMPAFTLDEVLAQSKRIHT